MNCAVNINTDGGYVGMPPRMRALASKVPGWTGHLVSAYGNHDLLGKTPKRLPSVSTMKGETICSGSKPLNLDNIGRRDDPTIRKWPWSFCLFCRLDTQFQFWHIVVLEATFACFNFKPSMEKYSLWMLITEWDSDVYNLPLKGVVLLSIY